MIGLWDGGSVPNGWTELVGFRNHFIKFNASGSGATSGAGTINISMSLSSGGISHAHGGGCLYETRGSYSSYGGSLANAHTHSAAAADRTYLPPYYALKFIKCNG
jgi:hypothetical protein